MEGCNHFRHPHKLSFQESLEGSQFITCSGCNFPCANGTPVYSCRTCNFFLHDRCFRATRSLIHPSHPAHPLTLFPSPTYPSGSFICNKCNQTGSGLCFGCSICDFDLHVHCAYNDLMPKSSENPLLKQIQLKAHPNHPLNYLPKSPYATGECSCDVCGTACDDDSALYHCDACNYDAHLGCVSLPDTVQREDHGHQLSLLHVNPHEVFECDVCRRMISKNNSMYFCTSACDYGIHVKCVAGKKVSPEEAQMASQLEALNMQHKMRILQKMYDEQNLFYRLR